MLCFLDALRAHPRLRNRERRGKPALNYNPFPFPSFRQVAAAVFLGVALILVLCGRGGADWPKADLSCKGMDMLRVVDCKAQRPTRQSRKSTRVG